MTRPATQFLLLALCGLLLGTNASAGRDLIIRGSVFCLPDGRMGYERPLFRECVVVVLKGYPEYATTTSSHGVFDLRLPHEAPFINEPLFIDFLTNSEIVHSTRIIVTPQELVREHMAQVYELPSPVLLDVACDRLSTNSDSCWQQLMALREPVVETEEMSVWQKPAVPILGVTLAGASSVGLFYDSPPSGVPVDPNDADTLDVLRFDYPNLALAQLASKKFFMNLGAGSGVAPHVRFAHAPFLNASSMGFAEGSQLGAAVETSGSFDMARISGVQKFQRFSFGYGLLYASQKESTTAWLSSVQRHSQHLHSDLMHFTLSMAKQFHPQVSAGVSANLINQSIQLPQHVLAITRGPSSPTPMLQYSTHDVDTLQVLVDVSMTLKWDAFRCGLSLNNIWGRHLRTFADTSVSTRSLALGFSYLNKRWHVGTDALMVEDDEVLLHANSTLFVNHWLDLGASYLTWNQTVQIGPTFKLPRLSVGYTFAHNSLYNSSHQLHVWTEF